MNQVNDNPILDYCKHIVFETTKKFVIERPAKFGGDVVFGTYNDLVKEYSSGKVHPLDLKKAVARELNALLDPVRTHFEKNKKARELYGKVSGY